MTDRLEFKDPRRKQPLVITTVPKTQLEVIGHQRKPRPAHLKALGASIERMGFITPLVTVERDGPSGSKRYVIIDGQHRFTAGSDLGIKEFPIVIVPNDLARKMMSLNVEKDLNIRERCQIALSIYREILEEAPNTKEDSGAFVDTIENPHYVTLALAYEENGRLAGSQFESLLKKCEGFMKEKVEDAYPVRQERGKTVVEAYKLTKKIADALKATGKWHSMVPYQIISAANPIARSRKPAEFDATFKKFIAKLEKLVEEPEKVLRAKVSEE